MNTRVRQKIKAELRRQNPDVMATIRIDGLDMKQIIFVPRGEIRQYKAKYGDRIEFWEVEQWQNSQK